MKIRALRADEIDVRVGTDKKGVGCSLLLYKDARVDMDILDETFGPFGWVREHSRDNANCTVSIWDEAHNQWIRREDTGTESNSEKEKGLASDSFKRACVNIGIGRELYTAPFIWVNEDDLKRDTQGRVKTRFSVGHIEISEAKKITSLVIVNERGEAVFEMNAPMLTPTRKATVPDFAAATPKGKETVAPEPEQAPGPETEPMGRQEMLGIVEKLYKGVNLTNLLNHNGIETLDEISQDALEALIGKLRKAGKIQ